MRILHFSDVHVQLPVHSIPLFDFAPKRVLGAGNLVLRRWKHHADAERKIASLAELALERQVDAVLCTGDLTALGTDGELDRARRAFDPFAARGLPVAILPGNHDIYVGSATRERRFERAFGDFLVTDLPEVATSSGYPRVRFLGETVAVVTFNSARPNPQLWRSSGRVPDEDVAALGRALAHTKVRDRFVIAATHYALRRQDGSIDRPWHGLVNADSVRTHLATIGRGLFAHGHVHHRYAIDIDGARIKEFCAGSATHLGREGAWLYDIDEAPRATPLRWETERYVDDGAPIPILPSA